ncbi:MAG TPA: hypothetical protein PK299_09465 [Anaerolineales bacterium]|nr:hypothetical protein [Anaerolineales bacterium]
MVLWEKAWYDFIRPLVAGGWARQAQACTGWSGGIASQLSHAQRPRPATAIMGLKIPQPAGNYQPTTCAYLRVTSKIDD